MENVFELGILEKIKWMKTLGCPLNLKVCTRTVEGFLGAPKNVASRTLGRSLFFWPGLRAAQIPVLPIDEQIMEWMHVHLSSIQHMGRCEGYAFIGLVSD